MTPSRQSHPSPAPVEAAEQSASAIRITSIYIAAAVLWIALSDLLITGIAGRLADHWLLQTAKGWGFVILTGLLLYRVLARDERRRMRLMAELQDNARWFQDLFELSPSPMWVCRLDDLRFLAVNRAAQAQYGYSEQEFLRMTIAEVRPAEDVPALLEAFQRVREGFAKSGTWRHRRKDGGLIDAEIFSARVEFDRQPALLVLAMDVTARCAAQRALAESEERLRLAMQAAHQGLYDVDVRTGTVRINDEFACMLGYAPEDLSMSAQRWVELLHPDDRERAVALYSDFLAGRVPDYRSEFRLRAADGTWRWMLSIGSIIEREGDGRPLRVLGTHTDISLEKERQAHIEWAARLRSVLAAINEAVVQLDDRDALLAEACRITVERGGLRMAWIGWVGEDGEVAPAASHGAGISYLTGIRISTDPSRPEGNGPPGQAIRLGAPVVVNDFLADARTARWQVAAREAGFGASAAFPLRIGRAVVGALNVYAAEPGFFTDELTALLSQVAGDLALGLDRQTAVSALRRGERLLAQAEQIAHLGSWELDLARGAGSWSAEMYRLMRRDPAAGPPTFDEFLAAVHPDDKAVIADAQARVFRDRTPVRLEYRSHPDLGPERTFLSTIYVESEPDGLLVRLVGTTQDVTEQRQAEEPARRWQQVFAASQLALAHADAATNVFIDVSEAFAREHGYTIAELIGQPLAMVYPPDVWESVHRCWTSPSSGTTVAGQSRESLTHWTSPSARRRASGSPTKRKSCGRSRAVSCECRRRSAGRWHASSTTRSASSSPR